MGYKSTSRSWVKLWVNEWLDGTTRYQMTDAQRAFWIDLLAMGGRSRYPGIVAAGKDNEKWIGYPLSVYQAKATSIDIRETLRLFADTEKISVEETKGVGKEPLFKITLLNWGKYQSEYMRQRSYRAPGTRKVTTKNTKRLPVEEEKRKKESRKEGEKSRAVRRDSAPYAKPPSPLVFRGIHLQLTERQDKLLGNAFPWVDRPDEYRKMDSWLEANPQNRPKKHSQFAHNWFNRIHSPGGSSGQLNRAEKRTKGNLEAAGFVEGGT